MSADKNDLLDLADRCVKCGLCLPACPTYRLAGSESESPRGRVALIEGLLRGQLAATDPTLWDHLESCLLCRQCEHACPSGVAFGRLMDSARELAPHKHRLPQRLRTHLLSSPLLSRLAIGVGKRLPSSLLPQPRLAEAVSSTQSYRAFHSRTHGRKPNRGKVGLFLGCIARTSQNAALHAAQELLELAGFEVVIPPRQGCCGAMHAHQGMAGQAHTMAAANRRAFDEDSLDAVVSLASGCGLHLQETAQLPAAHLDISTFLIQNNAFAELRFNPLAAKVLLHTPCTLHSGSDHVVALLQHIPQLQVAPITAGYGCCGAAGTHLLTHPDQAKRLRQPLSEDIAQRRPDYLLTSNPGCALHLAAATAGKQPEVLHPIELLARQCTNRVDWE